ncbi:transporter substrate-binding domain-containing protein [uncultured Pseudoalteromonas sp.]|uniref:substrate-binding periplasmic protein n=1 Tax=uncultured Pseudoalteromonas sp. TaxID=114053 RepID=UPI0030C886C2
MKLTIYSLVFLLISPFIDAAPAKQSLVVGLGETLPPYVMSQSNSGITLDIIKAALTPLGFKIEPRYYPYTRRVKGYVEGSIDILADINLNTANGNLLDGYISDAAYGYENVAIALKSKQFNFKKIADLANHSLISWPRADIHLGEEYAKMANANTQYYEVHDQSLQVKMLFSNKTDVIQMDKHSFDYYRSTLKGINTQQAVQHFALFGKSPNGYLFKSKRLRDDFNIQLQKLKKSGEYNKIFEKYKREK